MEKLIQLALYDFLGRHTIMLKEDSVTIENKNLLRQFTDEYAYKDLHPEFKTVRRGESEWHGPVYWLVVTGVVLFLMIKVLHSPFLKMGLLIMLYADLFAALYAVALMFLKKEFVCVFSKSGDCIMMIRASQRTKPFIAKLKDKVALTEPQGDR